ncbi:MAG TPA: SRPBCC family protein [Nocardioides sp.]|uniref:SRPBCC family protein n=1 Tax=Nocardioides sp. TaxID=35761 RepID=UPI002C287CE3|nr:SRPBCC family protein [Nocardioides sp.]HQR26198.1 SRPBCC family protein [Nocardioides sp.]
MSIWPNTFEVTTPDDVSVLIRRDFDAPPDKVWRAMTEPEHLRRWLGDASFPLTTCEMDVRVGGSYRWVFNQPDSPGAMGVRGTYEEVDRPHRIVSTEQFDDFPGPSLNTLVLDERPDDRTAMRLTVRYVDREMRDGWIASGMTEGLGRGYERLDVALDAIT